MTVEPCPRIKSVAWSARTLPQSAGGSITKVLLIKAKVVVQLLGLKPRFSIIDIALSMLYIVGTLRMLS